MSRPRWPWHDLHIHTRPHSPDAHRRATLPAMLKRAAQNGVFLVGLANHLFPTTHFSVFQKLRRQIEQDTPAGMTVRLGAEVCVLNRAGETIVTPEQTAQLDFVLAGPHHFRQRWVENPPTGNARAFIEHQQQMLLAAARNPLVNGLAHPWVINIQHAPRRWGFSAAEFLAHWHVDNFAQLGEVAKMHGTVLEIGMGIHLMAEHQGPEFWQTYVQGLQAARAAGARFYFGSDAHHLHVVARLDWLEPTLRHLEFEPGDIILPDEWWA